MALRDFSKQNKAPAGGSRFNRGARDTRREEPAETDDEEGGEDDEEQDQGGDGRGSAGARGGEGGANRFGRSASGAGGRDDDRGRGRAGGGGGGGRRQPGRGRYSGMRSAAPRPPQIEEGQYLLEVVNTFESSNPQTGTWLQLHLKVLDTDRKGVKLESIVSHRYSTSETSFATTGPKITSFVRASAGFASDEEMDEAFPNYEDLIDAAHGNREAEREEGPDGKAIGENPLAGARIEARVMLGDKKVNRRGQLTQYYEIEWLVPED